MKTTKEPTVGIIMGSKSDWKGVMEHCSEVFKDFGIDFSIYHRTSSKLHHDTAQKFFKIKYV